MRARGRQDAGRTHVFSGRLLSQPPWQRSSFAGTAQRQEILEPRMKGKNERTLPSSAGGSQTVVLTPAFNNRS